MTVEEYLTQHQASIQKQYQAIEEEGSKAIVTLKDDGKTYIHKISTVKKFGETIPDDKFFKKMRDGINNAVLNKEIPVVVFEGQKARITSLPDCFKSESS